MSNPGLVVGGQGKARATWHQRHQGWHAAPCVVTAVAAGFVVWWIVAEAATSDGEKVWWTTWWTVVLVLVALVTGVAGRVGAQFYRKWNIDRTRGEDDTSLFWLVFGGILASIAIAAAMGYTQAELLTDPGESVTSLESPELLDIARATTFALGALGAVAVLLVNYRKQRTVEAVLRHDQTKHVADLGHEHRKQEASEIAALHERYTKAVEQLADKDNPAIRLGGVHALAALAEDWAARGAYHQRQVCVDLVCSYLRNVPLGETMREYGGESFVWAEDLDFLEADRDARKAALEWLSRLATADATASPPEDQKNRPPAVEIDLRGVVLHTLDLSYSKLRHLKLPRAGLSLANLIHADPLSVRI